MKIEGKEERQLAELKQIKLLLAQSILKEYENQTDKILILSKCGFSAIDIAQILGTTSNTVSVTISKSKSKGKKKAKSKLDEA